MMKKLLFFLSLILIAQLLHGQTASLYVTGINQPSMVAFDGSGNLFVATYAGDDVYKIDGNGTTVATYTGFNTPSGLAFDAAGNLYVASHGDNRVDKVDASGGVTSFATGFASPEGITFDGADNLYVTNFGVSTISKVDPSGTITQTYTGIAHPFSIVIDGSGNLYVASFSGNTVTKLDANGNHIATYTGFNMPYCLALDHSGNLYISSYGKKGIDMIAAGSADGTTPTAFISGLSFTPYMMAIHDNALYASDAVSNVYKITGGILAKITHYYVKLDATGAGNGKTWEDAYTNLQTAIDGASSGDSIFVAEGIYQPASGVSFTMKEGVKIFGGFLGTETAFYERNLAHKATLQGNGTSVIVNNNNGLTATTEIDGFIVTGGNNGDNAGGGMDNTAVSPTIRNCVFTGNTASIGGAIHNYNASSPTIINCVFSGNAGIGAGGGAIYNMNHSNPFIIGCVFSQNTGPYGGAIQNRFHSAPVITNCVIYGNTSFQGGGIYNSASDPVITNSIIWGNVANGEGNGLFNNSAVPVISYSDIQDGLVGGAGNISTDPLFTNGAGGDYTLQSTSLCLNAGMPDTTGLFTGNIDIAGNPRVSGPAIDMGAYESPDGSLPVQLISFTGILKNAVSELEWQTGTEDNLRDFELQKSMDGKIFHILSTIKANGNNSYYEIKAPQLIRTAYYRLKMVDDNGKIKFSPVVILIQNGAGSGENNGLNSILVYPNPAKDYIRVKISSVTAATTSTATTTTRAQNGIYIYNASGVLVLKASLQAGVNKIDVHSLSAGVYYAKFGAKQVKFIKL
ncbi:T9SS type A sorting domain-containing protein [Arachidicoccus ginsenosidivorans]|uniref:T9SS type A sorting domain-containing protein n=1 Tax=Arachidicoccus ginsenosidivorans TaxID=496057 RepID=A0A5B8VSV9_9BACT|nr:T9SS type A sorting domain-containing protein [Arachidicoccus ginsenosidivorans]QEC73846.1 T9SS type A sorting domain-containing protein [Arachidicoccus ginsenosidivorans]